MLDTKICRTCQKMVDKKDGSAKLDEVDPGTEITLRTKLHVCVPEMMLADSNEDVICMICTNMLNLSYMFRNICIKTEQARHNNTSISEFTAKIKNETLDDTGIIVTRLQNPTTPEPLTFNQRTRSGGRVRSASVDRINAPSTQTPKRKSREGATRSKKGRSSTKASGNTDKAEERNGGEDILMLDGNQEPLLEVAYEESIGDSYERLSTASDYSIGSLRDIPEVIVRDPNTNNPPGGRTLRTRQNVSYVMPPDSPVTVQRVEGERATIEGGKTAAGTDGAGNRRRGRTVSGVRVGGARSGGVTKDSPLQQRSRPQSSLNLADVDAIDDFCRRNNRDPLEFLCSVPLLKCDTDIGYPPPPRGIMPCIDKCQCDLCGQQLTRYANLRRHRIRHFNRYSFYCTICGRCAYERYEIREHLEKRHQLNGHLLTKYAQLTRPERDATIARYRPLKAPYDTTNNNFFSKTVPIAAHINRPGPKSSKTPQLLRAQVTTLRSNAAEQLMVDNVVRDARRGSVVNTRSNSACASGNNTELKRRRISGSATLPFSAKRKKVSQTIVVGARFKYECVFCDVLVTDMDTLRVHLKNYHCNVCFKLFVGKSTKKSHHCLHVPQKVNDEIYYLCLDCDDYKSKVHFLSHLDVHKTRKLDQLFTIHPQPTYDSHSVSEKRRILPTLPCNLGKSGQECYFFCGDPDALKFHQVKVHGLTKLLTHIAAHKLAAFERLEKQTRPVSRPNTHTTPTPTIGYVEDFVDVGALDADTTAAGGGSDRCATCAEEMPNGPLEHECAQHAAHAHDDHYKCEICLHAFDRFSLIEHIKVHMVQNATVG